MIFLVFLIVVVLVALWVMGMYNGLVGSRNEVRNSWGQIDVQLKRRHDLIPNLVETVKGYMGHERNTLEAVTKARQQAIEVTGGVASTGGGGVMVLVWAWVFSMLPFWSQERYLTVVVWVTVNGAV